MDYTVERTDPSVLTVRHAIKAGWQQDHLLLADVHFDSPYCQRKLLKKLLDQALERGAGVMVIGDWLDAMQGRSDRRSAKDELGTKYKVSHYLDALVDDSVAFLEPYRGNLLMMSDGNHDTSIRRILETDLLARICRDLDVEHLGYAGFVRWMFSYDNGGKKSGMSSLPMWFHHGSGGGGAVTKGTMRAQRTSAFVSNAPIMVGGHIHKEWRVGSRTVSLSAAGKPRYQRQLSLCIPTLKDEFNLEGGFHIEKGGQPEVIGGYWLRFWHDGDSPTLVEFDAHLAI